MIFKATAKTAKYSLVQIIAGFSSNKTTNSETSSFVFTPLIVDRLLTGLHVTEQVPLLLIEKILGVYRARIVRILGYVHLVYVPLARQRDRKLLHVHGKIVELETLVEHSSKFTHLPNLVVYLLIHFLLFFVLFFYSVKLPLRLNYQREFCILRFSG